MVIKNMLKTATQSREHFTKYAKKEEYPFRQTNKLILAA